MACKNDFFLFDGSDGVSIFLDDFEPAVIPAKTGEVWIRPENDPEAGLEKLCDVRPGKCIVPFVQEEPIRLFLFSHDPETNALISRDPSQAAQAVFNPNQIDKAPVIELGDAPANSVGNAPAVNLKITNTQAPARYRKIQASADNFATVESERFFDSKTQGDSLEFLPEIKEVAESVNVGAFTKYYRVLESSNNNDFSPVSNILTVNFPDDGGTGGDPPPPPPPPAATTVTLASAAQVGTTDSVTITITSYGSGTANVQIEYREKGVGSWVAATGSIVNPALTGNYTIVRGESDKTIEFRASQSDVSGVFSNVVEILITGTGVIVPPPALVPEIISAIWVTFVLDMTWVEGTGQGDYEFEISLANQDAWETLPTSSATPIGTIAASGLVLNRGSGDAFYDIRMKHSMETDWSGVEEDVFIPGTGQGSGSN